jgi:sporulation protein YlmC with PRC-barrel domain
MLKLYNKTLNNLLSVFSLVFLLSISSVVHAGDVKENKVADSTNQQSVSQSSQNSQSEVNLGASDYVSAHNKNAKALLGFDVSGRQGAEMAFDVVDKEGERIGILYDYLLNKEGEIEHAVVIVRDLPVLDETVFKEYVAIPIDKMLIQDESDLSLAELQMKTTLTTEQVDQLPEFVFDGKDATQTEYEFSARELMDLKVLGKDENLLGILDDLIINNNNYRVTYALIKAGGVLGISDKLVAAPFKALQINKEEEKISLNVSAQALEDAPGFQLRKPY